MLASRRRHVKSDKRVPGWEYNVKDEDILFRGLYPFSWDEIRSLITPNLVVNCRLRSSDSDLLIILATLS